MLVIITRRHSDIFSPSISEYIILTERVPKTEKMCL